jgi:hypothetical protein
LVSFPLASFTRYSFHSFRFFCSSFLRRTNRFSFLTRSRSFIVVFELEPLVVGPLFFAFFVFRACSNILSLKMLMTDCVKLLASFASTFLAFAYGN